MHLGRLPVAPASTLDELLARARGIAGMRVGELAALASRAVPDEARRGKGLAGELVERALGVRAGGGAGPDVPALGVEIKSIPLRADGRPAESTFVCAARRDAFESPWPASAPRAKLAHVLFVPVEHAGAAPLSARRVGAAWLWSPTPGEDALLAADWEALRDRVLCEDLDAIDARLGRALQVRPKAPSGRTRARSHDDGGAPVSVRPRGLYLRASFTATLVPR